MAPCDECSAARRRPDVRRRRHHQPARVGARSGSARTRRAARARSISWQCRRTRRRSATSCGAAGWQAMLARAHRPDHRSAVLGQQDRAGCSTRMPDGAGARRRRALRWAPSTAWLLWNLTGGGVHALRRHQRLAHPAVQPAHAGVGRGAAGDLRHSRARCCPTCRRRAAIFGDTAALGRLAGRRADRRADRRLARGAFGHAALLARAAVKATYGTGSSLMTPDCPSPSSRSTGCRRRSRGRSAERHDLRARGQHHGHRRRRQWLGEAARPARPAGRRRRAGRDGGRLRRRLPRAGVRRPRRAALGRRGARPALRRHAGHDGRAPGARDARGHRLPGARRVRRDARATPARRWRSCSPTAAPAATTC